ncbi:MAG: family 43 glycosylhydrolase [Clostridia bacterium]|nr:family 43 glycosylhydrolase [Clostridia bacterium]
MKKYLSLLLLAVTFLCLFAIGAAAAEMFTNPVANGADPFVYKDEDGTYYLYVTSGGAYGYRVYTSTNLVEWEAQGYCLRRTDVYTDQSEGSSVKGVYNFWAPEIIKEGDTYYMVYTAQEHIGIATSDSPLGPFTNDAEDYLIPEFKNIDGHFFRDDDGKVYLFFVSAGAAFYNGCIVTGGNNIWGGQFDLETQSFVSAPVLLLRYDTTEAYGGTVRDAVAEGPEILKYNGTYYLTYSASGYTDPAYAVHYATSSSPLGTYTKYTGNPILQSDDAGRTDGDNPHLYGTAHHCFTKSPDGKEMIIVYHAHRTGANDVDNGVEERRICIDLAWFDEGGVLHSGRNKDGVPSATAQALPSGATLTREQHLDGTFASLTSLPTVYVASKDGLDTNAGTKAAPFKTLDAAYAALPSGGTIILTQTYAAGTYFDAPAVSGPIMIKGEFSAVPVTFKFLSVNSDTYFDNIVFMPQTANNISVIECNQNNVTMGEGVSCIAQSVRVTFPVLVGGNWWYTGTDSSTVYDNFKYANKTKVTTDKEYTLTVYSGTWSIATEKSVKDEAEVATSAPNATLVIDGDAKLRPEKASAPTVKLSSDGAWIKFNDFTYGDTFAIYKDGVLLGYSNGGGWIDDTYSLGDTATYTVRGYVNGACIGDESDAVEMTSLGDVDGDDDIDIEDVIAILRNVLNRESNVGLINVLVALKHCIK